jgi:DNA mismatch repair protein MutS2
MLLMPFSPGSSVIVLTLGKKKGVVVEAGRGGRYRVRVGNTVVSCREAELAASEPRRQPRGRPDESNDPAPGSQASSTASVSSVDLHGLTVEEALARVLAEIDRAIRSGADRVEVVHGKGSGRLRDALHRELAKISTVSAFRLDPRNAGVTWIYF